jgi:hypothetical protein
MSVHQRRLKVIQFTIDGNSFDCQVQSWTLDPGIDDGDVQYTFCSSDPSGDGSSFVEETDAEPTLDLTFYSDWRSAGVSTFLWLHKGETLDFVLDHHPNVPGEHVRWSGQLVAKPGPAGGDARDTEQTEVTLQIIPTSLVFEEVA